MKNGIRNPHVVAALFWLFVGFLVSISSLLVKIGTVSHPQPGFMSFFAGLLLIGLACSLLISELRAGRATPSILAFLGLNRSFLTVICCLVGYALLLESLGYLVSIGAFVFITVKMRSPGRWMSPLLWSIGVPTGTYLLFVLFLKLEFPKGVFGIG